MEADKLMASFSLQEQAEIAAALPDEVFNAEARHRGMYAVAALNTPDLISAPGRTLAEEVDDRPLIDVYLYEIEELELPTRAYNALKKHGIQIIGDLINNTEEEIASLPALGRNSLDELVNSLHERGLALITKTDRENKTRNLRYVLENESRALAIRTEGGIMLRELFGTNNTNSPFYNVRRAGIRTIGYLMSLPQDRLRWLLGTDSFEQVSKSLNEIGLSLAPED